MPTTRLPESDLAAAAQQAFDLSAGTPGVVVGVANGADTWFGS